MARGCGGVVEKFGDERGRNVSMSGRTPSRRPKLLFLITEDWFFHSHFIDRAIAAREAGFAVTVVARVRAHGASIAERGLQIIPLEMARTGMNPWREARAIAEIYRIYRRERPDIVHQIAVKPILYGGLAARLAGIPAVVNAPVGMGYVFSSGQAKAKLLRPAMLLAYRSLMSPRNGWVIFENPDDRDYFADLGIVDPRRCRLIRGAGVDMDLFAPAEKEPPGPPLVVLAARLLWDKGVGEFAEAARGLRAQGVQARFALVGAPDPLNPAAVDKARIEAWRQEGILEIWDRREDMPAVWRQAHIACLPSYREGLPKALIEAAASGLPIVATDAPGCREIARNGENGLLVPARSSPALADALRTLIENPELRRRMGQRSRELSVAGFSTTRINEETLAVYRESLALGPNRS
jgi:glycosyltransferase involved in cell wall biosynthesis